MPNLAALIEKLEAWRERDFHQDRQLADEVLIADGWQCEPDDKWEGGIRWFWGTNPQVSASEISRPHPVNNLNVAIGVIPRRHAYRLIRLGDVGSQCVAQVWAVNAKEIVAVEHEGRSTIEAVAVLIAALKAKQALTEIKP